MNDIADSQERYDGGDSPDFRSELTSLINKHSKENGSNTPDFILRDYLCDCLKAFDVATVAREKWHGRDPKPEHTRYGVELEK